MQYLSSLHERFCPDYPLLNRPLWQREEKLKRLLMKVKEEGKKAGLKLNIQKLRSWHLVPSPQGKVIRERVSDFIFLGSRITADGDCSHEIKRHLLLGRKAKTKQHIKKQRLYFANKCPYSQKYGFSSSHVLM